MKTILNLQSDYSKNGNYIQLSLPIHTETLIPVDDSVRILYQDDIITTIEADAFVMKISRITDQIRQLKLTMRM